MCGRAQRARRMAFTRRDRSVRPTGDGIVYPVCPPRLQARLETQPSNSRWARLGGANITPHPFLKARVMGALQRNCKIICNFGFVRYCGGRLRRRRVFGELVLPSTHPTHVATHTSCGNSAGPEWKQQARRYPSIAFKSAIDGTSAEVVEELD